MPSMSGWKRALAAGRSVSSSWVRMSSTRPLEFGEVEVVVGLVVDLRGELAFAAS
jgi:hypothetical protein